MQPSSYSDIIRRLLELGSFEDDLTAADACGLAEEREARTLSQLSHRPAGGGH